MFYSLILDSKKGFAIMDIFPTAFCLPPDLFYESDNLYSFFWLNFKSELEAEEFIELGMKVLGSDFVKTFDLDYILHEHYQPAITEKQNDSLVPVKRKRSSLVFWKEKKFFS